MQVTISDFGDQVTRVNLVGRLDIVGAQTIELPMATVSGSKCDVVVDMIGVDFIASIGIRHLVIAAQTLARSSRKLILLRPKEPITEVLMAAGLADVCRSYAQKTKPEPPCCLEAEFSEHVSVVGRRFICHLAVAPAPAAASP